MSEPRLWLLCVVGLASAARFGSRAAPQESA